MYSGARQARASKLRRRAFVVAGVCIPLALGLVFARKALHWPKALVIAIMLPIYLVGIIGLIVAINSSAKAERRSWAFAGKLWRSGFTRLFFRVAGLRLRPEDRAAPAADTGTHVALPDDLRRKLPELSALLARYDATLAALRRREEDVERALAEVGASAAEPSEGAVAPETPGGVTTRAVLLSRRVSLVAEMRGALDTVRSQRSDVVAAHENVRIQLARVRAGLATTGDLQPDVTALKAMLDAATPGV
jgi:hypothetical protein